MTTAEIEPAATMTAVVHAPDGVRFVASGDCPEDIAAGLVDYVRERCDHVLWPRVAQEVRSYIEARQSYAAIAMYFEHVGDRWDEERLELKGTTS